MFKRNELKRTVLECVQEFGEGTSGQISTKLKPFGVKDKNVSMTLLKCKQQGLLERTPYKHGRVRGYLYMLTERGRKRLLYYILKEGKVNLGVVDIGQVVETARNQVEPWINSARLSYRSAVYVCNTTCQTDVFFEARQSAVTSAYQISRHHELISAFAAKNVLNTICPEVSAAIESEIAKPSTKNLADKVERFHTVFGLDRLSEPQVTLSDLEKWFYCLITANDRLETGQLGLYNMLKQEEEDKEMFKILHESERERRKQLERRRNIHNTYTSTYAYLRRYISELLKLIPHLISITETNLKIIEYFINHRPSNSDIWYIAYCLLISQQAQENHSTSQKENIIETQPMQETIYAPLI